MNPYESNILEGQVIFPVIADSELARTFVSKNHLKINTTRQKNNYS